MSRNKLMCVEALDLRSEYTGDFGRSIRPITKGLLLFERQTRWPENKTEASGAGASFQFLFVMLMNAMNETLQKKN